ncbi:MAG: SWIM zinc finger family protein [Bacteroidota bacterium]
MTIDDLLKYAPDARALEGARRLFYSRRWRTLGGDGKWIWGEFEVKGNKALHTTVDLLQARFFCDCRSKKRPCTHALALLLKLKNRPDEWTVGEPPSWVRKHQKISVLRTEKAPLRESAQRLDFAPSEERKRLMDQGIAELEVRLLDIVRMGLAPASSFQADYWLNAAARLTDAQLPGLAGRVRRLTVKDPCTPKDVAELVGDLYLLCNAWKEQDRSDPKRRSELFRLMGISPKKDYVLTGPAMNDLWLVMGLVEGVEDRLRYRRVWLRGETTKRFALIIDYAFGDRPFERSWPLASAWSGDIHHYPGVYPRRGIFSSPVPATKAYSGLKGYDTFTDMLRNYGKAIAIHPWLPDYPVYLSAVNPFIDNEHAYLVDDNGRAYPIVDKNRSVYTLMALSAGKPISVFSLFDGHTLQPLSVYLNEGLVAV